MNFPNDGGIDYQKTVYTLTSKYCVRCHSTTASAATEQSPYFADPTLAVAYPAAIPKIDFTGCTPSNAANFATVCGVNSRFYQRLFTDNHNCWDNCASDAAQMLAQIQAFSKMLTPANIDPNLVVSKALSLAQGTIASGANRYDADTIAKYEFQTGSGYTAYDTSGVDPSADLSISGSVTLGRRMGRQYRRRRQAAGEHLGELEDLQHDPGDRRVLGRGLGRARAGGGRQLLHGHLFGRRHPA